MNQTSWCSSPFLFHWYAADEHDHLEGTTVADAAEAGGAVGDPAAADPSA